MIVIKPITWLTDSECANLYGKSIPTELPYRDFEWFDDLSIDTTKVEDDADAVIIF